MTSNRTRTSSWNGREGHSKEPPNTWGPTLPKARAQGDTGKYSLVANTWAPCAQGSVWVLEQGLRQSRVDVSVMCTPRFLQLL